MVPTEIFYSVCDIHYYYLCDNVINIQTRKWIITEWTVPTTLAREYDGSDATVEKSQIGAYNNVSQLRSLTSGMSWGENNVDIWKVVLELFLLVELDFFE